MTVDPVQLAKAIERVISPTVAEIRREQNEFREELRKNSEVTAKSNEMTEEMFELFAAAKGAFKVLGWIGKAVKWISSIAAAIVGLWLVFKGGFPPRG